MLTKYSLRHGKDRFYIFVCHYSTKPFWNASESRTVYRGKVCAGGVVAVDVVAVETGSTQILFSKRRY